MTTMEVFRKVASGELSAEDGAKLLVPDRRRLPAEAIVLIVWAVAVVAISIWGTP